LLSHAISNLNLDWKRSSPRLNCKTRRNLKMRGKCIKHAFCEYFILESFSTKFQILNFTVLSLSSAATLSITFKQRDIQHNHTQNNGIKYRYAECSYAECQSNGATTFSIMTLNTTILSIMGLFATLIVTALNTCTLSFMLSVANKPSLLNVVILNVVMLNVVVSFVWHAFWLKS
jgi:hypothetical protein